MSKESSPYTSPSTLLETYNTLHTTFATQKTKSLQWRKWQLKQCWWLLTENEPAIIEALKEDLNRDTFESQISEMYALKLKILDHIEKLEGWAKDVKPKGNGFIFGTLGKAHIRKEPLGVALIIGTWNFPFVVILEPLLAAIAAGNCVLLKPSEIAVHSQNLLAELIPKYLDQSAIRVVTGGGPETSKILELKFNQILYTGSGKIGRIVATAAAKHLTPCVLELGGQAPAIVTKSADVALAAKRIANTKFMNAGQICLAVNHVFVDPDIHDEFVEKVKEWLTVFFKEGKTEQFCKVINERNFDRLTGLLERTKGEVVRGGERNRSVLFFDPVVVTEVDVQDSLMEEEIFGPILPIIKADYREAYKTIREMGQHPLGLYIFAKDQSVINEILDNTNSGGVTINDALMHAGLPNSPFGGVGESGYGSYHGYHGFLAFSHERSVVAPPTWIDKLMSFRYPPYNIADLSKLRAPTKVPFKKGETMLEQKIGGASYWEYMLTSLVTAVGIAVFLEWLRR